MKRGYTLIELVVVIFIINLLVLPIGFGIAAYDNAKNGECVGLLDQGDQEEGKVYELSYAHIGLAVVTLETVVVPALIVLTAYECPVDPD